MANRTITFDRYSPPANVYEYRMDDHGNTMLVSKKGKNMENVTTTTKQETFTISNEQMEEAANLPIVDADEATLAVKSDANGEPIVYKQDEEDTNPV